MSGKTKSALLGSVLVSMMVTGCGLVLDAKPLHIFGAVLFVATLSFGMDMFPPEKK